MPKKVFTTEEKDPIVVELGGKEYTVTALSDNLMTQITHSDKMSVSEQLGLLFKVPAGEFQEHDIRDLASIVKWVMEQVQEQAEGMGVNPTPAVEG